jgi:hypothetical protein
MGARKGNYGKASQAQGLKTLEECDELWKP